MDVEATLDGKFRPHLVPVLTRVAKIQVLQSAILERLRRPHEFTKCSLHMHELINVL